MYRYFINFSYIGTAFRGIQKTIKKTELDVRGTDIHSVQGVIELALDRLRPVNVVNTAISSRTDAGVHALNTTCHVDLERKDHKPYNPHYITYHLNNVFFRYQIPIRVNQTYLIPPDLDFHCRYNAIGRTYLYRLAILKHEKAVEDGKFVPHFIPIEETDRCFFLQRSNFDLEAVRNVLPLFVGRHDFRTFMSLNNTVREKHCMFTIRTLNSLSITPAKSLSTVFHRNTADEHYNYYDIRITGRSFLYRQVRRIVGTLLAVAAGKLTRKDVYEMITIPNSATWPTKVQLMPASGLYLCEVLYRSEELTAIKVYNESFDEYKRSETKTQTVRDSCHNN